jgi:hypothetical protein
MSVAGNPDECQRAGILERRAVRVGHGFNHLQHPGKLSDSGVQEALLSRLATCTFPESITSGKWQYAIPQISILINFAHHCPEPAGPESPHALGRFFSPRPSALRFLEHSLECCAPPYLLQVI